VFAVVAGWNVLYGRHAKRAGERAASIARAEGEVPPAMPA
jgi:hypothetical protein